jgi:hypothetical protein
MSAGILTPHSELDGSYCGVPLCVDPGGAQPIMIVGMVTISYEATSYQTGAVAVESLGEVIGPNQAGDFVGHPGPVYFYELSISEYYGPAGKPQPQETPELQPQGADSMLKAVWSTAFVNDLPDSSFLLVESGGEKDEEGKTKPRSLRHFPYKDADGTVDLPHLRNAIARIPQAKIEGFDEAKMEALQNKARALLEKETAKEEKAEKSADLSKLPTPLLHAAFAGLDERYQSGVTTADMPPEQMREHGREIFGELQKRVPHIKMESPLLTDPEPPGPAHPITLVSKSLTGNPDYVYVLHIVMEPNDGEDGAPAAPDYDGEIYNRHAIRKLAFPYVKKSRNLGLMHEGEALDAEDAYIVQTYVVDDGFTVTTDTGRVLKQGVWLLGAEVRKTSVAGRKIESGEAGAWSIQGLALKKPDRIAA